MGRGRTGPPTPTADTLVVLGLRLSTSPTKLDLSSTEPFYIVVKARILSSTQPDKPVTLATLRSALDDWIPSEGFHNMKCTTNPEKQIKLAPPGPPQYRGDNEDLRGNGWSFVTIPPKDQGEFTLKLEVPRFRLEDAHLRHPLYEHTPDPPRKGEHYRFGFVGRHLKTHWWAFASLEELEGVRLQIFQCEFYQEMKAEYTEEERELDREKYGDGPVCDGEDPYLLVMVPENGEVEVEVVGDLGDVAPEAKGRQ